MSYKTATRRRRRRSLTSDTKARRSSAGNTRGCLACRQRLTGRHFAIKNKQKFKAIGLCKLCKISKFHCAMNSIRNRHKPIARYCLLSTRQRPLPKRALSRGKRGVRIQPKRKKIDIMQETAPPQEKWMRPSDDCPPLACRYARSHCPSSC